MLEVQSFTSMDEALAYVKGHEIATNNRYIKFKKRAVLSTDMTSLDNHRIFITPKAGSSQDELRSKIADGIPFIHMGYEERHCQYGRSFNKAKKRAELRAANADGVLNRRKFVKQTKKVECPARLRIKTVLKFPDHYIAPENRTKQKISNMLDKLRCEFSEQTKRYIKVFVHIDAQHSHEGLQVLKRHKPKSASSAIDEGCTRVQVEHEATVKPEVPPVLKKLATLKGKDMTEVAIQFKTTSSLPCVLARPKMHQSLENMDDTQLMSLYYDITGDMPNDIFAYAEKEFTTENLRLLLHLCIMFANAAGNEQTHPSVRIKGTENEYTPVQCVDADCIFTEPHMHCPFCAMIDSYTEQGLLKAHYKKQHVDKALEFSGLKILRCYDLCEVSSKALDCKTFKGGHWHCYKCSNAYEARQDMIVHYQRHLREYESSFLIHVAQDVNPSSSYSTMTHEIDNSYGSYSHKDMMTAESLETYTATRYVSGKSPLKRTYAESELDSGNVLYVEEDELGNVLSTYSAQEIPTSGEERVVVSYPDGPDVAHLKARIQELEIYSKKLEKDAFVQKSLIGFLEKKNADQEKTHQLEKEKLIDEIAALKGSETIIDDTEEVGTSGVDASLEDVQLSEGNNMDRYGKTTVAKLISMQSSTSGPKTVDCLDEQKNMQQPSVLHSQCNNVSCSQLSDIKKDIADLKSAFYTSLLNNNRLSATTGQNTSQLYFIPNQGITNPSQNLFPQNFTGFVNMNPLNVVPNSAGTMNLSLRFPQTVPTTCVVSTSLSSGAQKETFPGVAKSKADHSYASSASSEQGQPASNESELSKAVGDTQSVDTGNSTLTERNSSSVISKTREKLDKEESHDMVTSSETGISDIQTSKKVSEDIEKYCATLVNYKRPNAEGGDNVKMDTGREAIEPVSSKSSDKESVEMDVTDTEDIETPTENEELLELLEKVSENENTETLEETPTIKSHTDDPGSTSSQSEIIVEESPGTCSQIAAQSNNNVMKTTSSSINHHASSLTSSVTVSSKSNAKSDVSDPQKIQTPILNVVNSPGCVQNMPLTFTNAGLQNQAPLFFVPNQNYVTPYVAPQNVTGFVNSPSLNPFATNTLTFNPTGVQTSAPLVFVPGLGGASQYIVPQNNLVRMSTVPGLSQPLLTNTSVNTQQVTSGSCITSASTSVGPKSSNINIINLENPASVLNKTPASESQNTEPSNRIPLTDKKANMDTDSVQTLQKRANIIYSKAVRPPYVVTPPEKMKTRSSSKSLGDAKTNEAVSDDVTTAGEDAAAPSSSSSPESKKSDKKGYVFVLNAKSGNDPVNTVTRKGRVNTKSQVAELSSMKISDVQTKDKKKVTILSVKGDVDAKSIAQVLQKYRK